MTINKSQGQSFEKVGIYLLEPCFGHGQLYVALTRCKDHKKIFINVPKEGDDENVCTENIVIKEILN